MIRSKSFNIDKLSLWNAFKAVKANQGAAGVDGQSILMFEENIKDNLYKLWNRMTSGTYFPTAVKRVNIPKAGGGKRPLGIPTVADRIAQMVVAHAIEPQLESIFHPDSFGYRPQRSAHDAIALARRRCWRNDWVLDIDIKGFFDNIDHDLLMKAVRKHVQQKWALLYIERWLKAHVQLEDGSLQQQTKGTPQGGVISPLLANLFLHYVFDEWMKRHFPIVQFERYADDIIVHCKSRKQANMLYVQLKRRFTMCGLEMHPKKTKVVYCKDNTRRQNYPCVSFDFLGYTFKPRKAKDKYGRYFVNFLPAMSIKAAKAIRQTMRQEAWHRKTSRSLAEMVAHCNTKVRGWIAYYGRFYPSALQQLLQHVDYRLAKWMAHKYKRLHRSIDKAFERLNRMRREQPRLFAHWAYLSSR